MNKKAVATLQYIFFLGVGIFLLWLTLRKSDWNAIVNDLSDAEYIYLVPATLMLILSHFIRALRWKILIEPLGYRPCRGVLATCRGCGSTLNPPPEILALLNPTKPGAAMF